MRRKMIFGIGIGLLALLAGLAIVATNRNNEQSETLGDSTGGLPISMTNQISQFTPYYFENKFPPGGLTLDNSSVGYSSDVLIYSLVNSGGLTLTVTQQDLPKEFSSSLLQGDENFDTPVGKATVSITSDGRATGSLVTNDGVLILVNTGSAIELSTIKDVLRGLRPHN